MNIGIVGCGYVGLTTAACFADCGHNVFVFDKDKIKIKDVAQANIPFYEPFLLDLVTKHLNKSLFFSTQLRDDKNQISFNNISIWFICVGTPSLPDGSIDLQYVNTAVQELTHSLCNDKIIVIKSTVLPGVTQQLQNQYPNNIFVFNPEFLAEGSAIKDFLQPDRVVLGYTSKSDEYSLKNLLTSLYETVDTTTQILHMSSTSAELVKYTSNVMLASRVALINEIARIADVTNANIQDISLGVGLDHRIGRHFLRAGIGYGGSCFTKDIQALTSYVNNEPKIFNSSMLTSIENSNEEHIEYIINKLKDILKSKDIKCRCLLYGLAFKENTSDIRNSRALRLYEIMLTNLDVNIDLIDDAVDHSEIKTMYLHTNIVKAYDVEFDKYDIIIFSKCKPLTNEEYNSLQMSNAIIFDVVNNFGFDEFDHSRYVSIGRC